MSFDLCPDLVGESVAGMIIKGDVRTFAGENFAYRGTDSSRSA